MTQPALPGLEDIVAEFMGADSWPGLLDHIRDLARRYPDFSVDDVTYDGDRDSRIKGAALQHLWQRGEIAPLGVTRTLRPTSHGRHVVRWAATKED